jgi:hypothetical protein
VKPFERDDTGGGGRTAISGVELHADSSNSVRAVKMENIPLVVSAIIPGQRYHSSPVFVEQDERSSAHQKS